MTAAHSALIAIDWGTSNLRASLLDANGNAIETRSAPGGVMSVKDGLFADALLSLCGDWIHERSGALIASGMVGSRQGWKEAAYLNCPAGVEEAAAQLTRVDVRPGVILHILPGLTCRNTDGQDDVMRGKETQMLGADLAPGSISSTRAPDGATTRGQWLVAQKAGLLEHTA